MQNIHAMIYMCLYIVWLRTFLQGPDQGRNPHAIHTYNQDPVIQIYTQKHVLYKTSGWYL